MAACPVCRIPVGHRGGWASDGTMSMCMVCYYKTESAELSKERDDYRALLEQAGAALAHLHAEWMAWNPGLTGVARTRAEAALAALRAAGVNVGGGK